MKYFFLSTSLLLAPLSAHAADHHAWRSLPAVLWAPQVAVPPGTNPTPATQTIPGLPAGVQVPVPGVTPDAAQGVTPVQGGPPPPPGASPVGIGPGGAPIRQMPPGVPAGAAPGATGTAATPNARPPGPQQVGVQLPGTPPPGTPPAGAADSPAIVPKVVPCEVTLLEGRVDLRASGGEFPIPVIRKPTDCPASVAISVPWLELVNIPRLLLVAQPNSTQSARDAVVLIGGRSFFVRQPAEPQPALAAAPSRLVFSVNLKGESSKQRLAAWGEPSSSNFVARPQHPWLVVILKSDKDGRQVFEVAIKSGAALPPGRHDSAIELFAAGSPNRSLTIPVVVEVEGRFH